MYFLRKHTYQAGIIKWEYMDPGFHRKNHERPCFGLVLNDPWPPVFENYKFKWIEPSSNMSKTKEKTRRLILPGWCCLVMSIHEVHGWPPVLLNDEHSWATGWGWFALVSFDLYLWTFVFWRVGLGIIMLTQGGQHMSTEQCSRPWLVVWLI